MKARADEEQAFYLELQLLMRAHKLWCETGDNEHLREYNWKMTQFMNNWSPKEKAKVKI